MKKIFLPALFSFIFIFIQSAHAEWGSVITADNGDYDSSYPIATFNDDGDGAVVWEEETGVSGEQNLYINFYKSGSWGSPQKMGTFESVTYDVAINNEGSVFLVYRVEEGSGYSLYKVVYNGTSWSSAELVSTGSDDYSYKILSGPGSQAFLIWQIRGSELYLNRYSGGSWSADERIVSDDGEIYFQNAAVDSLGKIVVTVSMDTTSLGHVSPHVTFFDGDSWSSPRLLTTSIPENYDYDMGNVMNDAGDIWVTWKQEVSTGRDLYLSYYSASDGTWSLPDQFSADFVYYSDADLNENGDGVMSWVEYKFRSGSPDPTASYLFYSVYKDGAWSGADFISETCDLESNVHVSINDSGEILAVWVCDENYVFSRYYDGSQWEDEENLGPCFSDYACDIDVVFNKNGGGLVSWIGEDDNFTKRVYAVSFATSSSGATGSGSTGGGGTGGSSSSGGGSGTGSGTGGGSSTGGSGAGSTSGTTGGAGSGGNEAESQAQPGGCSFSAE